MSAATAGEAPAQGQGGIDARFEFDAPRYYDFEADSPESGGDRWFDTSATKGLASPVVPKPAAAASYNPKPQQQKAAADAGDGSRGRKALAHITNTTKPPPTGAAKAAAPKQHLQGPAAKPHQPGTTAAAPAAAGPGEGPKPRQGRSGGAAPAAVAAEPQPPAEERGDQAAPVEPPEAPSGEPPAELEPETHEQQAAKRRRTHGMATRSMTPGRSKRVESALAEPAGAAGHGGAGGHGSSLTVPKSPRLATKRRTRPTRFKPREVVEEEEMAAMPKFKARPLKKHILLDKSGRLGVPAVPTKPPTEPEPFALATDQRAAAHQGGSAAAAAAADGPFVFKAHAEGARVTRSKKRAGGITEPQPFALATDTRGAARQAQQAAAAAHEEQQPRRGKRRRISGPPQLATDMRGERTQAQLEEQRQRQLQAAKEQAQFKALPVNKAALQHPFKPAPSSAQLTLPQNVALASDARARERMEFDHAVALKQQLEEEERAAEAERRQQEEEQEVRKLRKGLKFKAQPLPDFYGRHDDLS